MICILLLLVVALALLYYNWGNVALSGICSITRGILDDNRKVIDDIEVSDEFNHFLNECFFTKN